MNIKRALRNLLLLMLPLGLLFCSAGCGNGGKSSSVAPFSSLTWNSSLEELKQTEGEEKESYASNYNGVTYVYDTEYQGRNGTLKYMFDADEKLMCIAWTYVTDDADDLDSVYQSLHDEVEAANGESGYHPSASTNYGDVWYRPDGDIILSAVITEEQCALQYAYRNPLVSNQDAGK